MREIAELMGRLARTEGATDAVLPGVRLYRTSRDVERRPLLYQQGVIIVGQGAKRVHLGGEVYEYDPDHYLVLSVPLPAECEARVCPEEPLLSMAVDIDMGMLLGILGQLEDRPDDAGPCPGCRHQGLALARADGPFKDTVLRLLHALASPVEGRVLGPGLVRELLFRIVRGENGATLLALAQRNTGLARIDKALRLIHSDYSQPFNVDRLAGCVNMSASAFHRTFKDVTSLSPIQYVKKVRLNKARSMLVEQGVRAGDAARLVGYESVSQFSREFKRYFGTSPGRLPELIRA
jgi:AraC-like DNA-binding protein